MRQPVHLNDELADVGRSTALLELLFTGKHRRLHSGGSRVIGILGMAVYATSSSVITSVLMRGITQADIQNTLFESCLNILAVSLFYVALMLTTQFVASTQLPLSMRLAMICALNFVCWQIAESEQIDGVFVIVVTPLSLGGFIQQWRGWRALGWAEAQQSPSKFTIASMLDVTASIALILSLLQTEDLEFRSLAFLLPTWTLMGICGMHLWFRLTYLCKSSRDRENGFVLWLVGSAIAGVVLILGLIASDSQLGLVATLLMIPSLYVLVHCWTAIPLWWLSACGWTFAAPDECVTKKGLADRSH